MVQHQHPEPELFKHRNLTERQDLPTGRVIIPSEADPAGPAFFEWELRAQAWSDEHPHDEYVFVLEGSLEVSTESGRVTAEKGDLVKVPAGTRGTYAAPGFARVLSIYGPRPPAHRQEAGVLTTLNPEDAGQESQGERHR